MGGKSTKASQRKKDPNAPRRPLSAYFLWLGDNRAEIAKALPDGHKVADVAKAGGEQWKKASAATKKKYEDQATTMKEEYNKELEAYSKKHPSAPKRPLNAYLLWLGDNRAEIAKALPDGHKFGDVAKAGGERWKEASAATKNKYEDRAKTMREEYNKELEAYKASIA